ncbi:DUF4226 domain-containing protein [Mycobacterium sp.]|uniref:DUF4226 domain-containing protein n=1 Tax=Mycobacterium sp. TaxID=1785 RepID=UPI0025E41B63|nr:DUF4226 domain-containing protein [Mycobacterium sp.]MBW0013507.1 DUF4226 domain-containing protein [Mycobacterium sp.]
MSEQAGPSLGAIQARQSALVSQHTAAAEADRALQEALASAHAVTRESIRRLDAIGDEIDRVAGAQADLPLDTPLGARELRRFLVAKQREITQVVADARELDRAKSAALERLRAQYAVPAR